MKLIEYYLRLFITLANAEPFRSIKITRSQISKGLDCTERNASIVLTKMEANQWIKREVGRGRGNVTTITFLKTVDELLQEYDNVELTHSEIENVINILKGNESSVQTFLARLFGVKNRGETSELEHLKIPYFRSLYSLIPTEAGRQTERHLVQQLFNTLVIYNDEKKEAEPSLSYYWERDHLAKKWTFYLRKGVLFHNGKYLEAEDVAFTIQQLKGSSSQWMVQHLEVIECIGKHVIQFSFAQSVYNWDVILCSLKCSILPLEYGNQSKVEFARMPIGTGPYKVKIHKANEVQLLVHHDYFQERAHIDEISIIVLPSIEKFLNTYEMEQEPLAYLPFITETKRENEYHFIERKHLSVKYLSWNGKMKNERLRKKVTSIIDREKMVRELGYPRLEGSCSFINTKSRTFIDTEYLAHGETLLLMTYELNPNVEDCLWIQAECRKHGMNVELEIVPYDRFLSESSRADLVLTEYVREEAEEVGLLNHFFSEENRYKNMVPEKDMLTSYISTILKTEEKADRYRLLEQLESEYVDRGMIVPLYSTYQKAVHHEKLKGTSLNTVGFVPFKDLFFRKS
jgi:SgrR family transcriptional regulator